MQELRAAPQAGTAHPRAGGELRRGARRSALSARHEHVAHIFALGERHQREAVRHLGGHVLGRVHGQVGGPSSMAASSSLVNRPLSPILARGASSRRSPLVWMTLISTRSPGCSASRRSRTHSLWMRASFLPREPMRRVAPSCSPSPRSKAPLPCPLMRRPRPGPCSGRGARPAARRRRPSRPSRRASGRATGRDVGAGRAGGLGALAPLRSNSVRTASTYR